MLSYNFIHRRENHVYMFMMHRLGKFGKMAILAGLFFFIGAEPLNAHKRIPASFRRKNVAVCPSDHTAFYVLAGCAVFVIGLFSCLFLCKKTEGMRHRKKVYHAMLRALPDLALILDGSGQHVEILTPKTDSDGNAKRNLFSQFLPSEHFLELMESVRLALKTGYVQNLNFQSPLTTGETWFDIHIAPLDIKSEKSRSALVLIRDTTPQKRAEASSRSTEKEVQELTEECDLTRRMLETFIENLSDPAWITDRSDRYIAVNASLTRIFQKSRDEIIGHTVHEAFPAFANPHSKQAGQAPQENNGAAFELHLQIDGGKGRSFRIVQSPVSGKQGETVATVGIARDITDQKKNEDAVLEIKERFRAMVEKATDCFMIVDKNMRITYISPSVTNVTGHTVEDLLGMRFAINIHPDDQNKVFDVYTRTFKKTSTSMPFTCRVKHQDGSWHVLEAVMNNMEDNPAVCGIVVNFRDITEQYLLERQFQQVQKMETMGQLAGGVAHDFNNCLQSIQGLVELLIPQTPAGTPQEEDLQAIKHASLQAASVTRQLLAFSQRQTFEARILDLNTVVHDQQKILARLIGENTVVEFRPEPLLWPICADIGQIQQVIMNLIVNARDAMPLGGHILITTANTTYTELDILPGYNMRAGRFVRLSISDSGNGMSPEVLAHIFEPFFTTKERGKGTGLGLSVVHGIVKQHDGWIHVYSTPGNGSEFKIYLPIRTPVDFTAKTEKYRDLPKGNGQSILLVEDDPAARIVTSRNLILQGYTVHMTTTVTEARSLFIRLNKGIDLLLCDVVLPDGNGVDLTQELQELKPDLQIIMTSGYADDKARWHEITGLRWNFLQKPYAFDELFRLINHCLTTKKSFPRTTA